MAKSRYSLADLYQGAVFGFARAWKEGRDTWRGFYAVLRSTFGLGRDDASVLARAARQGLAAAAETSRSADPHGALTNRQIPYLPGLESSGDMTDMVRYRLEVNFRPSALAPIDTRIIDVFSDVPLTNEDLDSLVEQNLIEHQAKKAGSPKFAKDKGATVVNWQALWVASVRPLP